MSSSKTIFVDMDNTIAIYDQSILKTCERFGIFIPKEYTSKNQIASYLRSTGQNDIWTKVQAYCYSYFIKYAAPAQYAQNVLNELKNSGYQVILVSHKTEKPAFPLEVNLQEYAKKWLFTFFENTFNDVHFFKSKNEKINYIVNCQPDFMIDDLPEIFHSTMLGKRRSLLYSLEAESSKNYTICRSWLQIRSIIIGSNYA